MPQDGNNQGFDGVSRRNILKSIGVGSTIPMASSVVAADSSTSVTDNKQLQKVVDEYLSKEKGKIVDIYLNKIDELVQVLDKNPDKIDGLENHLEVDRDSLISFETVKNQRLADEVTVSFNITSGTPTANIYSTVEFPEYSISLFSEPEAERSYSIVTQPNRDDGIIINSEDMQATACIRGTGCKQVKECKVGCQRNCRTHNVYCCQDYCYWGGDKELLCRCGVDNCPNCEFHCGTWEYCNGN